VIPAGKSLYEERVVLFLAHSFDEAIAKAEAEAAAYSAMNNATYLGYVDCHELAADAIGHRVEIYSLMRTSGLAGSDFVDHSFDDGTQRSGGTAE